MSYCQITPNKKSLFVAIDVLLCSNDIMESIPIEMNLFLKSQMLFV